MTVKNGPQNIRVRKMSDFPEEFGFIPPELLYKCDSFVRAFHDARGSGKKFVAASAMFSVESPYLTNLIRIIVRQGKIIKVLGIVAVIAVIISILTNRWWLLAVIVPAGAAMRHLYRLIKFNLVQQRAIILAVEALATDFAGWGQLFPVARSRAEAMFAPTLATGLSLWNSIYLASAAQMRTSLGCSDPRKRP
jgi:hypothetical protein